MLIVASLVAMVSRRIGLPYTAGLVLAGIGLAYVPVGADLPLSRELIFNVFLPPLIFEAAMQLRWSRFRTEMPLTIVLAFLGVAISAAVVAGACICCSAGACWARRSSARPDRRPTRCRSSPH